MSNELFPKGWENFSGAMCKEEIDKYLDNEHHIWVDSEGKPTSCYVCPFVIWYSDYKRCPILKEQLHPCFRTDVRLKACPIRVEGLKE